MLKKPRDGWSRFHLFDVDIVISYLFANDNPFGWLKACQFGLENQLPATLQFDSEERGDTAVIANDRHTTIFINDAYDGISMYIYEDYNILNLTEDIFMDISRDFDSWIEEWIALAGSPCLSSNTNFMAEMWRRQGADFWENETLGFCLKKTLREVESALLGIQWKGRKERRL